MYAQCICTVRSRLYTRIKLVISMALLHVAVLPKFCLPSNTIRKLRLWEQRHHTTGVSFLWQIEYKPLLPARSVQDHLSSGVASFLCWGGVGGWVEGSGTVSLSGSDGVCSTDIFFNISEHQWGTQCRRAEISWEG